MGWATASACLRSCPSSDLFPGPGFGSILGGLTLRGLCGAPLGASAGGASIFTGGHKTSFVISTIAFAVAVALICSERPSSIGIVRKVTGASGGLKK